MFGDIPGESESFPVRRSELSYWSFVSVHFAMNREGNQRWAIGLLEAVGFNLRIASITAILYGINLINVP